MGQLVLRCLGTPEVRHAGDVVAFPTRKSLALLIYLSVEDGFHSRDTLTALFWPESDAQRGRAALRRTLAYVREALAAVPGAAPDLLVGRERLAIDGAAALECDVNTLNAAWSRARIRGRIDEQQADRRGLVGQLQTAVACYRGDFLDGFSLKDAPDFDTWASVQREAWRRRLNVVFDRLWYEQSEGEDPVAALETAARWVALFPLNEAAHRCRMLAHFANGDRAAALLAYEECRALLIGELNADPAPETVALAERLRREALPAFPGLAGSDNQPGARSGNAAVPPASPAAAPNRYTNLPLQSTSLIGREQDAAAVRRSLLRDHVRLLTLVGPPGIGKTRLSVQVATEALDDFADGVCFVALAAISDPKLVGTAIAQALGNTAPSDEPPIASVHAFLRQRQLLLVLDNFEQVLPAARLVADLLSGAPGLKVLVTSRTVLHVYGEHEFTVPPLALPTLHAEHGLSLEGSADCAAVTLFVERAQAVAHDWSLTSADVQTVAEICVHLDGLPLAIELAAARSKLLPPRALLARLEDRLSLLTGGGQDRPTRQQTLRHAIDWSYNLLDVAERTLFPRLGVFVGGWTEESAEAVCTESSVENSKLETRNSKLPFLNSPFSILNSLASLLDKSLVQRTSVIDGEPRFAMLETIREYALERLAQCGELDLMQRRHMQFCVALAELVEPKFEGIERAEQGVWLQRVEAEHDNLRAALAWSLTARNDPAAGLRLASALWQFWWIRGYMSEGRRWLAAALADNRVDATAEAAVFRAKALRGAGALAWTQGDYRHAQRCFEESLALCREQGNRRGIAAALIHLGNVTFNLGDNAQATHLFEESLALMQELGDSGDIAWILAGLGNAARQRGDYVQADTLLEQGLALFEEIGYTRGIAWMLNNQGEMVRQQGDFVRAKLLLEQSLALHRSLGDQGGIATLVHNLGLLAHHQGEYLQAKARYRESLTLRRTLGDKAGIIECLEGLAEVAAFQQQSTYAARLLGAAQRLRDSLGAVMPPGANTLYQDALANLRTHLAELAFATAWAEGQTLPLEEVIAAAITSDQSPGSLVA